MQGTNAAFSGMSLDRGRDWGRGARPVIVGAVVAAAVGCIAAYALHARHGAPPLVVKAGSEARPAPPAEDPAKLFGAIIVEPEWLPKSDAPTTLASLGPESPAPAVAPVPPPAPAPEPATPAPAALQPPAAAPAPPTANLLPDVIPLPPVRDVPRIDDSVPLPPERPPEFAEPTPNPAAPDRRIAEPGSGPPTAPADDRNIFQKLLGIGQQPGAVVASRPPAPPAAAPPPAPPAAAPSRPAVVPVPTTPPATMAVAKPAESGQGRGGFSGMFGSFSSSSGTALERLGYDRQTAIYVISARAVYLPDGTRLEAHSGLGAALDDLRYVSARAVGPTPPHLYELTMREALFHGVQALRLNPVGEGGLYGRAGLLAHPYMLGPNGDSNGCVSVKDYNALLRAYQNGQIRKLAVVASL